MDRLEELNIIIPQLTKNINSLVIDVRGTDINKKIEYLTELKKYHVEWFKLMWKDRALPSHLQ